MLRQRPLLAACTLPGPGQPPPGGLFTPKAGKHPSWGPAPSQGRNRPFLPAYTLLGPAQTPPGALYPPRAGTGPYLWPAACVKLIKDDDKPCVKLIKDDDKPCVKLIKDEDSWQVKPIKHNALHHLYVTLHSIFITFTEV